MPGEDIQSWSTTAANNANADIGINWAEHQARDSVNNSARSMMAAHAKSRNLQNGSITTTGSGNAQAFASGIPYTVAPTGLRVLLKMGFSNTGPATLNMDSIGDVAIKDISGADLGLNALAGGSYAEFIYNGTNWILLGVRGTAATAAIDALASNTGLQINGAMEVAQEGVASSVSNTFRYVMDGYLASIVGGTATCGQAASTLPGFRNVFQIVGALSLALGANDNATILHRIEGYRWARLAWAQPTRSR